MSLARQVFTGKERDAETGLDFFGARYYSGAQGRFTSPDPFQCHRPGVESWLPQPTEFLTRGWPGNLEEILINLRYNYPNDSHWHNVGNSTNSRDRDSV
jgi:hypothetical protein